MSRFFHGAASESDSESSSEESAVFSEEEEEEDIEASTPGIRVPSAYAKTGSAAGTAKTAFSRFLRDEESSDDESSKARVVRSAKDKMYDDLKVTIKSMENGKKINDWVAIQNEFDKLTKQMNKAQAIISRDGVPRFYIKCLTDLEDFLKVVYDNKDAKKKMNATNAKALTAMKQKLRKNNKQYEKEIEGWRANPVEEVVEEEPELDEEESEDDHDQFQKETETEEESEEESESGSEGDSDDSMGDRPTKGVDRWKKSTSSAKATKKKDKAVKPKKTVRVVETEEDDDGFTKVAAKGKTLEITAETLPLRLREVLLARGKKGTDRMEQIRILEKLLTVAKGPIPYIKVLMALISSRYDYNPSMSSHMSVEMWKSTLLELNTLVGLLESNPDVTISEEIEEEEEDEEKENQRPEDDSGSKVIRGSFVSFISRLDREFLMSLQNTDPHTVEYIERLKDETPLYGIIKRSEQYFAHCNDIESVCRLKMMRVEHIYYKPNALIRMAEETVHKTNPKLEGAPQSESDVVQDLCIYLYKHAHDRLRTRAVLCHVYHLALNNRFYEARDMLLMSHLQESIQHTDVSTQILYNRVMVQTGMCAFRNGLVRDCHACLNDMMSTGRVKELLAQGVHMQRFPQNAEVEKAERQRQLPFHMHVNLELLEAIHLTASMLLEIPSMAANAHEARKKVISKQFRRMLEFSERQVFTGPPENTRDHIMQASKFLANGDWKKARDMILAIKIWDLIPNVESIKDMLTAKIKEEGLRTYFFTYGNYYDSVGLTQLSAQFELPDATVYAVVSKMIINEELHASINKPTNVVILHRVEPSRLQFLALSFSDKASGFVEANEKLLDTKINAHKQAEREERGERNTGDRGNVQQRGKGYQRSLPQQRTNFQQFPKGGHRGMMPGYVNLKSGPFASGNTSNATSTGGSNSGRRMSGSVGSSSGAGTGSTPASAGQQPPRQTK